MAASVLAALVASACCVGPLVLATLGLGSLGLAATLEPLRPWFLGLTAVLLALGAYHAYRPLPQGPCGPESECAKPPSRTPQRVLLWIVLTVSIAVATFPGWGAHFASGRGYKSAAPKTGDVVTFQVSGMTCEACSGEIEGALLRTPGVIDARVDYASASAEVRVTPGTDPRALLAAVQGAGYHASYPSHQGSVGGGKTDLATLAGRWHGHLTVGEGRTSELVVDLGLLSGRWVGQFGLQEFGVEDYPVDVAVDGSNVALHLTAARIDFEGVMSAEGKRLAGVAMTQGHRDSLVLDRVGPAHFSKDFMALEAISNDSPRLALLGTDAEELRRKFNDDRAYTRFLMLLSPT